jgi:hypothetical protein
MREGGVTSHVSQGAINGNGAIPAFFEDASSDGSRVFFTSDEPLSSTDTDTFRDLYMREGNTTAQISQGAINGNGAVHANFQGASSDGSRVFFNSGEPLASTDTDTSPDVYLRESNTTIHVSQGAINGNGAFGAFLARISNDGSRAFFGSAEPLVSTDTDASQDAFAATIDSTPPQTSIDSGPAEGTATNSSSPTFGFSADESASTFQCRLFATGAAAPAFTACSGPGDSHTPVPLADGAYTFEVVATDATNNTDPTPAARSFSVDTTAPDTEITDAKLKVKKVQRLGKKVKIKLKASAGEPVDLLAKGKIKLKGKANKTKALKGKAVKLKAQRKSAGADQHVKLTLKPAKKKDHRKVLGALDRGKKAKAKVTVRFSDSADNELVRKTKVKLKLR